MPDPRPYFLALALESAPLGVVRLARPARKSSAYVAAQVADPAASDVQWDVPAPDAPDDTAAGFCYRRN